MGRYSGTRRLRPQRCGLRPQGIADDPPDEEYRLYEEQTVGADRNGS